MTCCKILELQRRRVLFCAADSPGIPHPRRAAQYRRLQSVRDDPFRFPV
jgi:hypothetical protein